MVLTDTDMNVQLKAPKSIQTDCYELYALQEVVNNWLTSANQRHKMDIADLFCYKFLSTLSGTLERKIERLEMASRKQTKLTLSTLEVIAMRKCLFNDGSSFHLTCILSKIDCLWFTFSHYIQLPPQRIFCHETEI